MSRTRGVLGCLGILVVVSAPAIGQQPTPAMAETPAVPATPAVTYTYDDPSVPFSAGKLTAIVDGRVARALSVARA